MNKSGVLLQTNKYLKPFFNSFFILEVVIKMDLLVSIGKLYTRVI